MSSFSGYVSSFSSYVSSFFGYRSFLRLLFFSGYKSSPLGVGVWRPFLWCGCFWRLFRLLIFLPWIWWCSSPVHGKGYNFWYGGFFFSAIVFRLLFFRLQVFSPGCGCLAPLSVVWVFLKAFSVVDISFMNLMVLLTRSWKGISFRYWRHFLFEFFFSGYFSPWVWVFGAPSCGVGIFDVFLLFFLRKWCSSPVHKKGISRRYGGFFGGSQQLLGVEEWRLTWRRKDLQEFCADLKNTHHYWMTY